MGNYFEAWIDSALCATRNPEEYDRPSFTTGLNPEERKAKRDEYERAMCEGCPVMRQCALDALEYPALANEVIRAGTSHRGTRHTVNAARKHWRQVIANE